MIDWFYKRFELEPAQPAKASSARWLLVFRICASVFILALLFLWLPTGQLLHGIGQISGTVWVQTLVLFLVIHCAAALKWRYLLAVVNASVSKPHAIRAHGAGLFANLCLPSIVGGDFVRAAMVAKRGVAVEAIAVGSLVDRLIDTLALVLIASVGAWQLSVSSDWVTPLQSQALFYIAIALLLLVFGGVAVLFILPLQRLPQKIQKLLMNIQESVRLQLQNPAASALALLWSMALQIALIGLNILLAQALGLALFWALWFFAWPMAKLIALVPVSLGGIGVRDAALVALLAPYVGAPALVLAQSLSWQIVLIFSGVVAGLLAAFLPGSTKSVAAADSQHG